LGVTGFVLDAAADSQISRKRLKTTINTIREVQAANMVHGFVPNLLFALIAAALLTLAGWLWGRAHLWQHLTRARARLWGTLHKSQIEEINELRKDVDTLLSVLDHWVTPGAGDKQRQFEYIAEVLEVLGKKGISGAYMRVACLIDDSTTSSLGRSAGVRLYKSVVSASSSEGSR
jgi:hypothetical protein